MKKVYLSVSKNPIASVSKKFLSVALDFSQILGEDWWHPDGKRNFGLTGKYNPGPFDFSREKLIRLSRLLSPAFLRISGTKCDNLLFPNDISKKMVDEIFLFAKKCGFDVFFGLNAGIKVRNKKKEWVGNNAKELLLYVQEKKYHIRFWELGNEINAFLLHGIFQRVSGKQYAKDYVCAKKLLSKFSHGYLLSGPSCAFWPIVGEPFSVTKSFVKHKKSNIDVLSWHYYPQQSSRSLVATKRAKPDTLLQLKNLDEIEKWAQKMEKLQKKYTPDSELWLTETGHAQCGGQSGVSDRFVSSLWWLDQLGVIAKRGHKVMVRQTLSGSDYGLINDEALTPNPDFFASVMWKKFMGESVYSVKSSHKYVRIYAHETKDDPDYLSFLVINIDQKKDFDIRMEKNFENLFLVTSPHILEKKIFVNGEEVDLEDINFMENLNADVSQKNNFLIPPCSYAFFMVKK